MSNLELKTYIDKCKSEFMHLLGLTTMPNFNLKFKNIVLELVNKQGYGALATAHYNTDTDVHTLEICSAISQTNTKHLIFHELTHIIDADKYCKNSKIKFFQNKAYTEFHAAQIDTVCFLNTDTLKSIHTFDSNKMICTLYGNMTINEYAIRAHNIASELIKRDDFPANIETLSTVIGLIFNYYGRRSICKMYSDNFVDNVDNSAIATLINAETIDALNNYMLGWFDDKKVAVLDELCGKMLFTLVKKYNLM